MAAEIRLEGLRELQRALSKINKDVAKEVREELKLTGEPVRASAQSLAFSRISNIGSVWGRMRLGVTMRSVYIAPATRNRGGSPRPNLGRLLLGQAMWPAVERARPIVVRNVQKAFERLAGRAGFH